MKFFHLADLHLGKSVYEHSLLPDQQHFLDQVTAAVRAESPAAVIIAGDVFDRAVPPPEAVRLFGDFLAGLKAIDPGLVIAVIPGNHDSATRLSFASGILGLSGVHIRAEAKDAAIPVMVQRGGEQARLWLLPFLSPGALTPEMFPEVMLPLGDQPSREMPPEVQSSEIQFPGSSIQARGELQGLETASIAASSEPGEPSLLRSQADLFAAAIYMIQRAMASAPMGQISPAGQVAGNQPADEQASDLLASPSPAVANILVCHAFATGGAAGESERVFLGSAELVDPALFEAFDYVALGHLHRCQSAGAKGRYAGSPIAYAFSEGLVDRGFLVVEVHAGSYSTEFRLVKPLRRMVRVSGSYDQVLKDQRWQEYEGDYIEAILDDADAVLNPMGPLRERFPFLLSLKQAVFHRGQESGPDPQSGLGGEPEGTLAEDDFVAFHQELRGCPPDPALMDLFIQLYREATDETP